MREKNKAMGANLKEVRERISSIKSTQQITKAMKMVSAAKLRKAQNAITQMRPYADKLNDMLTNILSNLEDGDAVSSFGTEREIENAAVVVVTSTRGLCGAFNTNIVKEASKVIEEKFAEHRRNKKLTIFFIGKKGYDGMKRKFADCTLNQDHQDLFQDLGFDNISKVSQMLMDEFENKNFDNVTVCYARFKNAATTFPLADQFLPVPKIEADDTDLKQEEKEKKTGKADYIFEPSKKELLDHLIPSILQTKFQKYLLDTHASEHGARMTAMSKATDNAEDLIKELKITYNKARQEAITKELSEIVGGAAALESA